MGSCWPNICVPDFVSLLAESYLLFISGRGLWLTTFCCKTWTWNVGAPPGLESNVRHARLKAAASLKEPSPYVRGKKNRKRPGHPGKGSYHLVQSRGTVAAFLSGTFVLKCQKMTGIFLFQIRRLEKKKNGKVGDGNIEMHLEIITGVSRKNPAVNINLSPLVGIMIKKDRKNTFKVSVISHIQALAAGVPFQYFCIFIHFKHTIRTCLKIKYKYTIGRFWQAVSALEHN